MKLALVCLIMVLVVQLSSSQPTHDVELQQHPFADCGCQQQDVTLDRKLAEMNNKISLLEKTVSQIKSNAVAKPTAFSSCTCNQASSTSPCVSSGGHDCNCDVTDSCEQSHVCGVNVALMRPALQISTWRHLGAFMSVDGNLATDACTGSAAQPWWTVDLGAAVDVGRVCVTNSGNEHHGERRMSNFVVGLTNNNPYNTAPVYKQYRHVQYPGTFPASATGVVSFGPTNDTFRYVIIQQLFSSSDHICMNEVKVFLRDPSECVPGETAGKCHENATCAQIVQYVCGCKRVISYRCVCNEGFTGNGISCAAD